MGTLFYFAEQPRTQDASLPSNDPDASKLSEEDGLPSAAQARISVATALGVAAANAKLLADQEEQEIEHLVASVIDNQVGLLRFLSVCGVISATFWRIKASCANCGESGDSKNCSSFRFIFRQTYSLL